MLAKNIFIYETESVKDALKKLDKIEQDKLLLVTGNGDRLLGTITDGDIRRYILRGKNLESDIKEVYNKNPIYLTKDSFSLAAVKKIAYGEQNKCCSCFKCRWQGCRFYNPEPGIL